MPMTKSATVTPLGKRDQNRLRNRQAILDAAKACFLEKPYTEVSVRDIIRRTDLAAGTFYNYFTDKASIFRALVDDYLSSLNERLHHIRRNATSMPDMVRQAYVALFSTIQENPALFQIIRQNEATLNEIYQSSMMGLNRESLKRDLEDARQRGLLPQDTDIDYLAACFFGVAYEMGIAFAHRPNAKPEDAADFAMRLFLNGLNALATH